MTNVYVFISTEPIKPYAAIDAPASEAIWCTWIDLFAMQVYLKTWLVRQWQTSNYASGLLKDAIESNLYGVYGVRLCPIAKIMGITP